MIVSSTFSASVQELAGYGRRHRAVKVTVAEATVFSVPDARRFHLAFILELDVQASHDGLEDFEPGPALGRRGFEVVHDRRLQVAQLRS
jgi:hypothetical protein